MAGRISALVHSVGARLRRFAKGRHRVLVRGERFDARLPFVVTFLSSRKGPQSRRSDKPALLGFTRNLSETGMTLLLPSVRIGDAYLTDIERHLEIKLELPDGPLAIHTTPVRFEQLPRREAGCGYLLAVRIVDVLNDKRDRYLALLKTVGGKDVRAPERRKASAAGGGAGNTATAAQSGMWESLTAASVSKAFEKFVRE
jgi:hypothetical protein